VNKTKTPKKQQIISHPPNSCLKSPLVLYCTRFEPR